MEDADKQHALARSCFVYRRRDLVVASYTTHNLIADDEGRRGIHVVLQLTCAQLFGNGGRQLVVCEAGPRTQAD